MAEMTIVQALIVTAECCGHELSSGAAKVMAADLSGYPYALVLDALRRCRREVKSRLMLSHVIERIAAADGRPSPDEAWALASCALDEAKTIVWTDEMETAYGACRELHIAGDGIAARMAFREAYAREVSEARDERRQPRWLVSPGSDASQRAAVVLVAAERGRLSADFAREHVSPELPEWRGIETRLLKLERGNVIALPLPPEPEPPELTRAIAEIGKGGK